MVDGSAPALGVSFTVDVPGGRNLVFQTHVEQGISASDLNALLDKACTASDRLVARYTLPLLREQLATEQAQLERITADLVRVDQRNNDTLANLGATRRGPAKLSDKDVQQREQVVATVEAFKKRVEKLQAQIAECEAKVNGTDERADHQS